MPSHRFVVQHYNQEKEMDLIPAGGGDPGGFPGGALGVDFSPAGGEAGASRGGGGAFFCDSTTGTAAGTFASAFTVGGVSVFEEGKQ